MTLEITRVPKMPGRRAAAACVEQDLQLLSEHLRQCLRSRGPALRWQALLWRLRAFTATHASSLAGTAVLAGTALTLTLMR